MSSSSPVALARFENFLSFATERDLGTAADAATGIVTHVYLRRGYEL